ncbi:MAG: PilZ domain-containing protein [Pseudomonadales bacterium]
MLKRKSSAKNLLTVDIRDIHQLQFRYMPFVEQGGLFIETSEHYELGEQFFLLLRLMDEVEQLPLAVQVVWLAGADVKNPHRAGIGVQFTDPDNDAKDKIETYLAGVMSAPTATATL